MALQPFLWNGNQAISTPQAAERARRISEALLTRSKPTNWAEGLAAATGAYTAGQLNNAANQAETEGQNSVAMALAGLGPNSAFGDVASAAANPWMTSGQSAITSALLNQDLEQSDPMYQLQRQKLEQEIAMMGQPENPYLNVGGGSIFNTSSGEFMTAPDVGGQKLPADVQEYNWYAEQETAAGRQPLSYLDFVNAQKGGGLQITTNPDGTTSISQGGPAKPLTEGQSKDTVYVTRANGALPTIDAFENSLLSLPESMAGNVPVVGNYFQGEDYQLASTAGKEFLASILRKDTGAAVTPSEEQVYGDIYLPRPGDKPARIAYKKQARSRAVAAIEAGLPPNAIIQMEMALEQSGGTDPVSSPGGMPTAPAPVQPADDVVDWTDYFNGN